MVPRAASEAGSSKKRAELARACDAINEWADRVEEILLAEAPEYYADFKTEFRPWGLMSLGKVQGWLSGLLKVLADVAKERSR